MSGFKNGQVVPVSFWTENFQIIAPLCLTILIDWGPKPFRVFDCWLKEKSLERIVRECWTNTQPRGWRGYALKVKIKKLKEAMKVWNRGTITHATSTC